MNLFSAIVVFVLVWWMVFFMVLPIGVNRAGTDLATGSPNRPMLLKKALIVTVITLCITGFAWFAIAQGWLNLRPLLDKSYSS